MNECNYQSASFSLQYQNQIMMKTAPNAAANRVPIIAAVARNWTWERRTKARKTKNRGQKTRAMLDSWERCSEPPPTI